MNKYICLFVLSLISIGIVSFWQVTHTADHNLHIIFCNVGQGDAIFIRTPSHKHILVDGGPDKKILDCLSRHLPFWERKIDIMILSHPHADHLNGLLPVLTRYEVGQFVTEELKNKTGGFKALEDTLKEKSIATKYVYQGDQFRLLDEVTFRFLNPTKNLLTDTSPGGYIGESAEFANVMTLISYKSFHALLTGDSQAPQVEEGIRSVPSLDVLQSPHHGSRTGLSESILDQLTPRLTVISVGKNTYGHPASLTLDLLSKHPSKTVRTDRNGDIEVVSTGDTWSLKTQL